MSDNNAPQPENNADSDQQLEVVIADYIRACETGTAPNRNEILERHAELADELRQFFGQHERMNQIAAPIRGFGDSLAQSVGPVQKLSYVGNYELLEEIARGGMGVVQKARQTTLGRIVVSTPKAFISACSGDMYSNVPTSAPYWVKSVFSVSRCSTALATPKSMSLLGVINESWREYNRLSIALSPSPLMSDVTQILIQIESGDPSSAEQLLPLVYEELRKLAAAKLAHEKPGQTLQATALVHEAYLRLVDVEQAQHWNSRGHFFAAAAEAIQRILVDHARRKSRPKHGGDRKRVDLEDACFLTDDRADQLISLEKALAKLAAESPEKAKLVMLRYFAGLSHQEAAEALGISRATADRYWSYAKVFLHCEMEDTEIA